MLLKSNDTQQEHNCKLHDADKTCLARRSA